MKEGRMGVESRGEDMEGGVGSEEEWEKRCFSRAVKICSLQSHLFFKKVFLFSLNCYSFWLSSHDP